MAYNPQEAEDALSHAMLRASQKYDACADTLINPLAWLTTIVQNICFDHQRSFNHKKRWETDSSPDEFAEPAPSATAAPASSLEDTVSMRETIVKLEHQLLSLPASLREPLLMRVMEEKSYEEIAEDLNMTEHTARKRIQRARARLRYGTGERKQ
jgi:RNA polymerase sigma factor (sigma-70 family)